LKFLQFNLLQSLSHFYGTNDWHYYLSQGLPLLLTTFLPLTLYALYKFLLAPEPTAQHFAGRELAATTVFVTTIYSLIAHKEVRFLYPLLPILHVLSAAALESLSWSARAKRLTVWAMILLNLPLAYYVTQVHQRGVNDVVDYLRHDASNWRSAGFLMPCHSTPWRANIQGDGELWALGCEPPIDMTVEEKKTYVDEADEFYADPAVWMAMNLPGVEMLKESERAVKEEAKYEWPERLVFFQALEDTMVKYFEGVEGYEECWRGFNTHWHDDGRRVGDVMVWCLKKYV
jgi:phosphatidylinositol glycan class B